MSANLVLRVVVGLVMGGWLLFDGAHVLVKGKYFGPPEPGPWSRVVSAVGIDPFRMGVPFVLLGVLWLAVAGGHLAGAPWRVPAGIAAAVLTVWYLPIGTVLSALFLVLLFLGR